MPDVAEQVEGKPFGPYDDFGHCLRENQDRDDPEAFCGALQERLKDKAERPQLNRKNLVERKDLELELKAFDEDRTGTFTGYASRWDIVDRQNDKVVRGAFAKTLNDNSGMFVLLNQHDPDEEIGLVQAQEDEKGLVVEGQFYIDPNGDTTKDVDGARSAYNKMRYRHKAGKPLQMSIGYRAINPRFEKGVRVLHEIALAEISVVTFPALPEAEATDVKAEEKAGRVLSAANTTRVKNARAAAETLAEALQELLDSTEASQPDKNHCDDEAEAKDALESTTEPAHDHSDVSDEPMEQLRKARLEMALLKQRPWIEEAKKAVRQDN